jgi:hypothetical protein
MIVDRANLVQELLLGGLSMRLDETLFLEILAELALIPRRVNIVFTMV